MFYACSWPSLGAEGLKRPVLFFRCLGVPGVRFRGEIGLVVLDKYVLEEEIF